MVGNCETVLCRYMTRATWHNHPGSGRCLVAWKFLDREITDAFAMLVARAASTKTMLACIDTTHRTHQKTRAWIEKIKSSDRYMHLMTDWHVKK